MRKLIVWPLSLTLIVSYPLQLHPAEKVSEKAFKQFMVESVRDLTLARFAPVKTGNDAIKLIVPMLPAGDQAFANKHFHSVKKFPKLSALNRGFGYDYNGQPMTFVIDEAYSNKFVVNRQVPITYTRQNSLELQLTAIAKGLDHLPSAQFFDLLLPRAYAVIDWISIGIGAVITLLIGGVIMPTFETVRNEYIRPRYDAWYCEGKDPNDYRYSKSCGDYFKFQALQRPSIPNAKPTKEGKPVMPLTAKAPKCYSKESPTFTQDFANADESIVIRRTINYKDTKAIEMVETMIVPETGTKLTYKLNDAGQFTELLDGDNLVLTRDPKKKEQMTPEKFKEMEVYDKAIEAVLASLKLCDEATQAKLKAAADQDGSLIAKHVITSDSGSVPAPATKDSIRTTK